MGQSWPAADAGGEGHGPHWLEFADGEGWNVIVFDEFMETIELQPHDFLAKDPNKQQ